MGVFGPNLAQPPSEDYPLHVRLFAFPCGRGIARGEVVQRSLSSHEDGFSRFLLRGGSCRNKALVQDTLHYHQAGGQIFDRDLWKCSKLVPNWIGSVPKSALAHVGTHLG